MFRTGEGFNPLAERPRLIKELPGFGLLVTLWASLYITAPTELKIMALKLA